MKILGVLLSATLAVSWFSDSSASGASWGVTKVYRIDAAKGVTSCNATGELMGPHAFPAMVQFLPDHETDLPRHYRATGPVPEVVKEYKCGAFEGFIVRTALHGKYRRENDAFARRMHYPIRKWPYVPLHGQIVQDKPTSVLEIYEGLYEFRSDDAAKQYFQTASGRPDSVQHAVRWHFPWTYRSWAWDLGNPRTWEHAIYVGFERNHWVITLSVQGGNRLSGTDASEAVKKAVAALGWSSRT